MDVLYFAFYNLIRHKISRSWAKLLVLAFYFELFCRLKKKKQKNVMSWEKLAVMLFLYLRWAIFNCAFSSFLSSREGEADPEPCYVDVSEDSITYRSALSQAVFHLKHLKLFPASCRGLRWCAPSELHLSLQAKNSQGKESVGMQCDNGIITYNDKDSCLNNQDILVDKIKQCQNRCYCAGCGRPIFTSKG